MVDLPTLKDFSGVIPSGQTMSGGIHSVMIMLIVLFAAILVILMIVFLFNFLSYNINTHVFDGITTLKGKGKYSKDKRGVKFKLRGMADLFVVQPQDDQFYYEKPTLPFLPVRKHVFFAKINDVLIPAVVNKGMGSPESVRNVKIQVGQEQKDGSIVDMMIPLTLQMNPHFDTSEINLRSFLRNEMSWADDTYKDLKSLFWQIAPFALTFMAMIISLLMLMFTLQYKCS